MYKRKHVVKLETGKKKKLNGIKQNRNVKESENKNM